MFQIHFDTGVINWFEYMMMEGGNYKYQTRVSAYVWLSINCPSIQGGQGLSSGYFTIRNPGVDGRVLNWFVLNWFVAGAYSWIYLLVLAPAVGSGGLRESSFMDDSADASGLFYCLFYV